MSTADGSNSPSSPSSHSDRPTRKTKRNRKILSCSLCRVKKIRCDRVQPTCGRCLQVKNACYYTLSPFRDDLFAGQNFRNSYQPEFTNMPSKNDVPYDFALDFPHSSLPFSQDGHATLSVERPTARGIHEIYAVSTSSAGKQLGPSNSFNYQSQMDHMEQFSVVGTKSRKNSHTALIPSSPAQIQFHGSSAAMNVIYSTPTILREVRTSWLH
jgi:hypothetical protein